MSKPSVAEQVSEAEEAEIDARARVDALIEAGRPIPSAVETALRGDASIAEAFARVDAERLLDDVVDGIEDAINYGGSSWAEWSGGAENAIEAFAEEAEGRVREILVELVDARIDAEITKAEVAEKIAKMAAAPTIAYTLTPSEAAGGEHLVFEVDWRKESTCWHYRTSTHTTFDEYHGLIRSFWMSKPIAITDHEVAELEAELAPCSSGPTPGSTSCGTGRTTLAASMRTARTPLRR